MRTKNYFIKTIFTLMVMFIFISLNAQEMVVDGNMENADSWTAYEMGATEPMGGWEWNYTDDLPFAGSGGCFRFQLVDNTQTNTLIFQLLTLTGGTEYTVSGDVKVTGEVTNFWAQVYISKIEPEESVDWTPDMSVAQHSDRIFNIDTWGGDCCSNYDGSFAESCIEADKPNPFVADGDPGTIIDYYLGIKCGVWGSDLQTVDVLFDNISVMGPGATSITNIKTEKLSCYPVPAKDKLFFANSKVDGALAQILNVNGQMVRETLVSNSSIAINELKSGMYFIKITTDNYNYTTKFVKE